MLLLVQKSNQDAAPQQYSSPRHLQTNGMKPAPCVIAVAKHLVLFFQQVFIEFIVNNHWYQLILIFKKCEKENPLRISLGEPIKWSCCAFIFQCNWPFNDSLIGSGIDLFSGTLLPGCFNERQSAGHSNLKNWAIYKIKRFLWRDFICPSSYIYTLDFSLEVMDILNIPCYMQDKSISTVD